MTQQSSPKNWQPPDGLGYSSLRPVRLTTQGIAMAVIGVVFLLAGPVLSYVITAQIKRGEQRDDLLSREGVETTAVITRVWRSGGRDNRHMVSYRFTAGDRPWDARVSVPRPIWTGLRSGDALSIRYVPGQPNVSHPTQWPSSRAPNWLPWLLVGVFSWPGFLFWGIVRRQQRLLLEGRPAPGVITRFLRTDKQVVAYYEFTLLSGQVMKGKSGVGRHTPGVGSQICVLYNPENPRRNAIYPLQMVKLERS
jgi:hypothetical protein